MLMELNLRKDEIQGQKFYYGRGCDRCNNTGHRGRMGIFELVTMNDEIRDLVSSGVSTDQLYVSCRKQGMTTLRESGLLRPSSAARPRSRKLSTRRFWKRKREVVLSFEF